MQSGFALFCMHISIQGAIRCEIYGQCEFRKIVLCENLVALSYN